MYVYIYIYIYIYMSSLHRGFYFSALSIEESAVECRGVCRSRMERSLQRRLLCIA